VVATLAEALASVAPVVGINSHMGSRLTGDEAAMRRFARGLGATGPDLFFVDSRTTPRSVAGRVLRASGIRVLERDVFLDHVPRPAAVRRQLERLLAVARRRGHALGIGHPHRATLDVLRAFSPARAGVKLVPVSALLALDGGTATECAAGVRITAPAW
jgi:polysaccharide deacetylase 2 family uncharacterized protein YibQ